jgi:dTDP-4-dehydrorhamnose 3,5-epimerase
MQFESTALDGAWIVRIDARVDARGLFARTFCEQEFTAAGLPGRFVQCNTSFNEKRGTLRGLHWQGAPHEEGKLVRCTQGAIFDVAVDLRRHSRTYCQWAGLELTASNRTALYVPPGFAHGFQTLTDSAEVFYQMTVPYVSGFDAGAAWNDPAFHIQWPLPNPILSPRDRSYLPFAK